MSVHTQHKVRHHCHWTKASIDTNTIRQNAEYYQNKPEKTHFHFGISFTTLTLTDRRKQPQSTYMNTLYNGARTECNWMCLLLHYSHFIRKAIFSLIKIGLNWFPGGLMIETLSPTICNLFDFIIQWDWYSSGSIRPLMKKAVYCGPEFHCLFVVTTGLPISAVQADWWS